MALIGGRSPLGRTGRTHRSELPRKQEPSPAPAPALETMLRSHFKRSRGSTCQTVHSRGFLLYPPLPRVCEAQRPWPAAI